MNRAVVLLLGLASLLPAQPLTTNFDETKVPAYTLPDVLGSARDAKTWDARRQEILEIYRRDVFGRSPAKAATAKFEATSEAPAFDGKAVRKIVTMSFGPNGPRPRMLMYLPANAAKPVRMFLGLTFGPIHLATTDPGVPLGDEWVRDPQTRQYTKKPMVESTRGRSASRWPIDKIIAAGYGLAIIDYNDFEPDFDGGRQYGIRPLWRDETATWGAIGAWAWGLSRAMDYLETDPKVDAKHVAVFGHSRLGKTSLWAGAEDPRFAMVIANESGEGGAAISRRNYGERTKDLNRSFPHWFCANFRKYDDKEDQMPFDSHFLIALSAPRPLYVASAEGDQWSDPRGEFLGVYHAGRVYELLGKKGIGTDKMPALHEPIQHDVAYHIRGGKHDVTAYDWEQYIKFADQEWR